MAVFIFKVICCTMTVLLSLISCLLCKVSAWIVVMTIKALKAPGVALQSALEQVGGLVKCCLERVLVLFLKNILMATKKVVDLFVVLVVQVIYRLMAAAGKSVGCQLVEKMKLWLKELKVSLLKMILKNIRAIIILFLNLVVDVASRLPIAVMAVAGELVKMMTSGFHELVKVMVYCLEIMLDVIEKLVLFYDLVLEVLPRWLVAVGKFIDQMTMAFHELMQLMQHVAKIVGGLIETLSPVIKDMIKKVVSLLYERVVDYMVEHVKEIVFGYVFGAVLMSEYHQLIQQIFESVVRSMVEKFMAIVMYLLSRKTVSIER
ncbi:hypothetical protein SSX86_030076 [Deinandra increscens subsp. villosa]|uniref:Uncharacterized protein n=1 Tax=Deinandra increscens subsp. villosa TaxID=3103831 RepID=A0AAP0GM45_9ASTR